MVGCSRPWLVVPVPPPPPTQPPTYLEVLPRLRLPRLVAREMRSSCSSSASYRFFLFLLTYLEGQVGQGRDGVGPVFRAASGQEKQYVLETETADGGSAPPARTPNSLVRVVLRTIIFLLAALLALGLRLARHCSV